MDLLYKMANSQNIVIIVEKMIEVLRITSITDEFLRKLLVERIIEISEKYPLNKYIKLFLFFICNIFVFNKFYICFTRLLLIQNG